MPALAATTICYFYLCRVYTLLMDRNALVRTLSHDVANVCVCRKTRETARKISRLYDDMLQPAGIKTTQFTMLAAISMQGGATLTELAESLGMERTTLSRNLKPLERSGLIEVSAEGYRRARSASITDQGVAVMEKALPLWRSAQKKLKKRIGGETWERIQTDLNEIGHLI